MIIPHQHLERKVSDIFAAAGCGQTERERIAHYLVEANLVGHDSHGVIRVSHYIDWLRAGKVRANQTLQIVFENDVIAVVDGQFGFGQVMGEQAMKLGIAKSANQGVAVVALRNSGHLGRIGDWAELAAGAGKVSLHFVNTNGGGILAAPFGGTERRLSANPIAAGVPVPNGPPIILDISTCMIAEGKLKVAFNKGVAVPDGCIVDGEGRPTNDPKAFYASPPGAILPFGGHKGFGLSIIAEALAGALSGGACSRSGIDRVANNMLSIIFDPAVLPPADGFTPEIGGLIAHVKSSRTVTPEGEILMPGEPEARTRARRLRHGIEIDETTWGQIAATAQALGVTIAIESTAEP
ncbi:MAG: malate/lactate/ureidoglycolate dehydrogenase [Isosphaeraceae bacterium]